MAYDLKAIEEKWQRVWEQIGLGEVDVSTLAEKFYVLTMFPYPSGDRLHMGHWYQYGIMDSWARYQRMRGRHVFQPMGFDAFGLPAENFAIKKGVHPAVTTERNVAYMVEQFKRMGVSYAWRYMLNTSEPNYYRWNQWLFLRLFERGLAYRQEAPVNWCPSCQTVLANEQVHDGVCERCETEVTRKNLKQWFFKITDYAQRLLDGIDSLDWPHKTQAMQRNWIGRSEGAEIVFKVADREQEFRVFTTRPDTLFGVTYMVLAPEHPLVEELATPEQREAVSEYVAAAAKISEIERLSVTKEKTGVFTGGYAINPVNGERVPIWIADYVLYSYGTGAVMAVPGHDERDFEFARKYDLEIRKVIQQEGTAAEEPLREAFVEPGTAVNSGPYDGMFSQEMITAITNDLDRQGVGGKTVNFRLRDWLVSRQRYWGTPIPIIYCDGCGTVPVPDDDLPVELPREVDFKPTGESPLARCESFVNTTCPSCGGRGRREVDTLDTFVCSSWYFLRFPSVGNDREPFDPEITRRMLPVDKYVGGAEHACMHLLYARFVTMVLHDLGYVDFDEPFPSLTHQGTVLGRDGQKMSKSRGNSVSPDPYVAEHGSDILRLYLMFGFNYVEGGPWDDGGFKAVQRFADRLWRLFEDHHEIVVDAVPTPRAETEADKELLFVYHNSLKGMTEDTERFQFNTSIARMMELLNALTDYFRDVPAEERNRALLRDVLRNFIVGLAPFAPHLAEELWQRAGGKQTVFDQPWPSYDPHRLERDEIEMAVMINGKVRDQIRVPADANAETIKAEALATEKVQKYLDGHSLVKEIIVPKKLINLILKKGA